MSTIAFPFTLRDVGEIEPWRGADGTATLSWFGLTDGWYDVVIDEHRLFSPAGTTRGIDYQTVRLWEDLIELAPCALDPVPPEIATRLTDVDAWSAWSKRAAALKNAYDAGLVEAAVDWWRLRLLDAAHLVGAPWLRAWRDGDALQLQWASGTFCPADLQWSSPRGQATVPADVFRGALGTFDRELIAAMEARVCAIEQHGPPPGIAIDVAHLRHEQQDRATWLERALRIPRAREHSWDDVVAAIIALERELGPV